MVRLFDEHRLRPVKLLSGSFRFCTDPDKTGLQKGWEKELPASAKTVIVPSCWNNEFGLYTYEGTAWYSRRIFCRGGNIRLVFEGVMTEATVYWDGKEIACHYGGFTAFDAVLKNVGEGDHTLTLRVDNSFDADSVPQAFVDWYHYGGIIRDIELEELKGICILEQYLTYTLDEKLENADVQCHLKLCNFSEETKEETVSCKIEETAFPSVKIKLLPGETKNIVLAGEMRQVKLWSPESPDLYKVLLRTDSDDWIDRIGFRKIEAKDGRIYLNQKPFYFKGICRHEENPDFGFAFPRKLMKRDIDILKDLNCNAVRGSHYPNSRSFLDYLDESGIAFWSEIPVWGVGFQEETLAREKVLERGLAMHREMIAQYRNHPSILLWGLHNEILSNTENGKQMSKLFYEEVKSLDDSRLVTYASCHALEDISYEYCDVFSVNRYIGWYEGEMEGWDGFPEKIRAYLKEHGCKDKPILMSEFGAAALYGYHTFDNVRWTEEYQERLLEKTLKIFTESPDISGSFIWQFADVRTAQECGLNRARGFNNKGILNENRKPKLAYRTVQKIYKDKQ